MSRTLKLFWIMAVAYLLVSTNFSVPVKAQSTNLSCENIPQPNTVIYHQEPFKPKKGDKLLGNTYVLYVAKDLGDKDVRLEVKGLGKGWSLKTMEKKGVTNSDAEKIKSNEIKITKSGEYIIISPKGGDTERLELKSKDNSAIINPVRDKDEIVSVVEYLIAAGLELQGHLLGIGRQEFELESAIYDIAVKLFEEEDQKSEFTGDAALLITGRQAEEIFQQITEEILQDLGQFDAKQWLSTEEVVGGEPAALLQDPKPGNIKLQDGRFLEYIDKSTSKTSFGNRLSVIYINYPDHFQSYLTGFISQFDDEIRVRSLLNSAREKLPPNARPVVTKFLDDLKPYLKTAEQKPLTETVQKKPIQLPTEEQIRQRAQKIFEQRQSLGKLDEHIVTSSLHELPEESLIEILGGENEVNDLARTRKLADNYQAFKGEHGTRALDFLREEARTRIDLYGKTRVDNILRSIGIEPSAPDAENFMRNWDLREAELQMRLESELETFDAERYKTVLKQMQEENKLLNEFRKFNEKGKRILVPLGPDNFKVFVDFRIDEITDIKNSLDGQIPASEGLSRAMLAKMDEFSRILGEGKSELDSTGKLSDEFYNKVDKLFKDASTTLEDLPDSRQREFRSFIEIADEVRQGVDAELVNEKLNLAKEEALNAVKKEKERVKSFRENFKSKALKVANDHTKSEIGLRSDLIVESLEQYEAVLIDAESEIGKNGKISPETTKEIVLQLDRQQHVYRMQDLDINQLKRDNVVGIYIAKFKGKELKIAKDLESRLKHPTIARLKDNANKLWLKRQQSLSATRDIMNYSFNSKFYKKVPLAKQAARFSGPLGLGFVGVLYTSSTFKEYGEISGNAYVYWTGFSIDMITYGTTALTVIAEVFLFTGRALPAFLRLFSISVGGLSGIASVGIGIVVGLIVSKTANVIACKLNPLLSSCGCSANPFYGETKLVLSKNTARPGEVIGFMVYGAQYCENAHLELADRLAVSPDFIITKSCAYNDAGCCVGQARVEAPPGTYKIKAGGPSTEIQQFEVTGKDSFILYRDSLAYNPIGCGDGVRFRFANGLDSDVLVLFYITNDKGEVLDNLPRVSPPIKAHKKGPIEVGEYCMEMALKGRVKGEFKIAWTAHRTTDSKSPTDLRPIDLSYPNEALIAKVN